MTSACQQECSSSKAGMDISCGTTALILEGTVVEVYSRQLRSWTRGQVDVSGSPRTTTTQLVLCLICFISRLLTAICALHSHHVCVITTHWCYWARRLACSSAGCLAATVFSSSSAATLAASSSAATLGCCFILCCYLKLPTQTQPTESCLFV